MLDYPSNWSSELHLNNLCTMSCGIVETENYYSSPRWLTRSQSAESLGDRFDALSSRLDSQYTESHMAEPMMTLEDIKNQFNSCYTCGVSWNDNHVSLDCAECGGYSLSRPCPVCDGKCNNNWQRDVSMSHSTGKAHWEGECLLPDEERPSVPAYLAEDVLVQGLEELSTSLTNSS